MRLVVPPRSNVPSAPWYQPCPQASQKPTPTPTSSVPNSVIQTDLLNWPWTMSGRPVPKMVA